MPDTTDATARAVKLTKAREKCLRFVVEHDGPAYLLDLQRAGIRMETAVALCGLGLLSAVGFSFPPYTATPTGRAHPAARPRPDAATA